MYEKENPLSLSKERATEIIMLSLRCSRPNNNRNRRLVCLFFFPVAVFFLVSRVPVDFFWMT